MSNPQSEPLFDATAFEQYQWTKILDNVLPKECQYFSQEFKREAEAYQSSGDIVAYEVFNFLSQITSTILMDTLLGSESQKSSKSEINKILAPDHLSILRHILKKIDDAEMKARIADILWICKGDPDKSRPIRMAQVAIESYLLSAQNLENIEDHTNCYLRLRRAAQIAPIVDKSRKKNEMCGSIVNHIDKLISRYKTVECEFLTGSSMQVLQENLDKKNLKNIKKNLYDDAIQYYAKLAHKKTLCEKSFQDYHQAFYYKSSYFDIERKWYKMARHPEAERISALNLAELEVWYAEQALVNDEPKSYSVAAGRMSDAIFAFKKIEDTFGKKHDTSERIQDLHIKMLDLQKKSMSQMSNISITQSDDSVREIQKTQNAAKELVKGKQLHDALYHLAFGCKLIPNISDLETEANQDIDSLVPLISIDNEGKTKAVSNNNENGLEEKMIKIANSYQHLYGFTIIAPACDQICSEHNVTLEDLSFIACDNHPFIPEGHEYIYVKGLLAGLKGDPVVASHLIIPQLENSLRYLLKRQGLIASNLTSEMIQDEYTLNKVFESPDLQKVLPENIIFTLKSMLADKNRQGFNLRNEICHGLLGYEQFFTSHLAYLWWLTLYLCLAPTYEKWKKNRRDSQSV